LIRKTIQWDLADDLPVWILVGALGEVQRSRRGPAMCPAVGCTGYGARGCEHVQKGGGSTDQEWYIYPLV
jgi:hypothetical protein